MEFDKTAAPDTAAGIVGHPTPLPMKPMFTVDISKVLGADFAPIANDFTRMLCIQLAVQLLVSSTAEGSSPANSSCCYSTSQ